MRERHKLLVITPTGNEIEIGFLSESSDGIVLGATKVNGIETSHLTVLNKGGVLSSYITPQDNSQKEPEYFPKYNFQDLPKNLEERVIENVVTQVPHEKLLEDVFYFTQKFFNWLDSIQNCLFEKRTSKKKKEVIHVLNFKKLVKNLPQFIKELNQSPSTFFGICKAKEILEDSSIIFGFTDSRLLVMPFENQLYYLDFSFVLDFNPELGEQEISNPLSEIYSCLGINQYMQEVEEKKILDKLLSKDSALAENS